MNAVASEIRATEKRGRKTPLAYVHTIGTFLFAAQCLLVCLNLWLPVFAHQSWLRTILLLLAMLVTCTSIARVLPVQNVFSAVVLIMLISAAAGLVLTRLGGVHPLSSGTPTAAPRAALNSLWLLPCFWVVVVLNARGVLRWLLRLRRDMPAYGFWLLGFGALLAVIYFGLWAHAFGLAARPRPVIGMRLWHVLVDAAALALLALVMGVAITPALINKRPGPAPPPPVHPLWVSVLLTLVSFLS